MVVSSGDSPLDSCRFKECPGRRLSVCDDFSCSCRSHCLSEPHMNLTGGPGASPEELQASGPHIPAPNLRRRESGSRAAGGGVHGISLRAFFPGSELHPDRDPVPEDKGQC